MKAPAAQVLQFLISRAPEARPVSKLRVLEFLRRLIVDGNLLRGDTNVVQYLAETTDKKTGWAKVEVQTITDRVGFSRGSAVWSPKRLVATGVIEREARRNGKRCFASRHRLPDLGSEVKQRGCAGEPTPVHQRTTDISPSGQNPSGGVLRERARGKNCVCKKCDHPSIDPAYGTAPPKRVGAVPQCVDGVGAHQDELGVRFTYHDGLSSEL